MRRQKGINNIYMTEKQEYQVLARKYRSQNFDDLIGQDALVRTLKNAIETGRIAHAFMLTGIRGVGKTTTARLIAKALNYRGTDGKADPTTGNTDDCEICQAIAKGRHPDVIEMDAASNTSVDDIREIIDGVRYAPTSARYKIYIIDEVHMLSKSAFNALLKTLEEPPSHVKFIFATTEVRKIPVTVLSRCQRFDLRRVEVDVLEAHYKMICQKEGAKFDEEAITLISRAADGSVRDGLSLLDQAIALGDGYVGAEIVKGMLGLSDRTKVFDLYEAAITNKTAEALKLMEGLYNDGADPAQTIEDLLDLTHSLTRIRLLKDAADLSAFSAEMQERAKTLAYQLSMPSLNKAWQIFSKGLSEVRLAPSPKKAAEMVLIRLIYAAELPDPLDLIKKIKEEGGFDGAGASAAPNADKGGDEGSRTLMQKTASGSASGSSTTMHAPNPQIDARANAEPITAFATMEELYEYLKPLEVVLANEIYEFAHPVKLEKGNIEIRLEAGARSDVVRRLINTLRENTGSTFMVTLSKEAGGQTLSEIAKQHAAAELENARNLPEVQKIVEAFPGAKVIEIVAKDE